MNTLKPLALKPLAKGFSLVEMLVALAAGLIVSAAVVTFLMSSFKSNSDYVISTRLTQELRNTLDLATRDLRRAGYDDNSMGLLATGVSSPFTRIQLCDTAGTTCKTTATASNTAYACVIYAYDRPAGTPGALDVANGEVRGLRLKQVTNSNGLAVGVLEYAVSANATKPACNGATADYSVFPVVCNSASKWCPLSDATKLDITSFTLTDAGGPVGVLVRDIKVVLQGRPAGSTEYSRGVHSSVRVRSDCYTTNLDNCTLSP